MNDIKNISLNKKSNFFLKVVIEASIFVFFLAILSFSSSGIKNVFYSFSSPIEKTFWSAGASASGFLKSIFQAGFLIKENQNLKNENQQLLAALAVLQSDASANRVQSSASLAYQDSSFKLSMAGIIGLDGDDMLTINKGSADGIAEGMPVVNEQNVIYGKVFKVYKNYSQVMLITSKDSVIDASVAQQDSTQPQISGVIKGKGGLNLYFDLVPVDSELREGDAIKTSALEKIFPKNLLIGTITSLQKNDQKPFQQAQVKPFFDLKNTENLFVITNYKR
jgi:rod shape-determining protein MreC